MNSMVDPYAPAESGAPKFSNGWMTVGGFQAPAEESYNGWMTVGGFQAPAEEPGLSL